MNTELEVGDKVNFINPLVNDGLYSEIEDERVNPLTGDPEYLVSYGKDHILLTGWFKPTELRLHSKGEQPQFI